MSFYFELVLSTIVKSLSRAIDIIIQEGLCRDKPQSSYQIHHLGLGAVFRPDYLVSASADQAVDSNGRALINREGVPGGQHRSACYSVGDSAP